MFNHVFVQLALKLCILYYLYEYERVHLIIHRDLPYGNCYHKFKHINFGHSFFCPNFYISQILPLKCNF